MSPCRQLIMLISLRVNTGQINNSIQKCKKWKGQTTRIKWNIFIEYLDYRKYTWVPDTNFFGLRTPGAFRVEATIQEDTKFSLLYRCENSGKLGSWCYTGNLKMIYGNGFCQEIKDVLCTLLRTAAQ